MTFPVHTVAVLAVVTVATAVSQSFGRFTYAVLLTDIRDGLSLSNTLVGSLGSMNLLAYVSGTVVASFVAVRFGLARLASVSVAIVTVGLVILAWSPSVPYLALGLLCTGIAAAGVWVSAPALASAELDAHRRGLAIGIVTSGVGLGIVVGSALDVWFDWRTVYGIEASIAALVTAAMFIIFRARPVSPVTLSVGLGAIRAVPGWRALLVAYGTFAAGMSLVVTFLVALLEEDAGFSVTQASIAFSLVGIGSVLGGPLVGTLCDRVGRRFAMLATFVTMAFSTAVILTGAVAATGAAFVFGAAFSGIPVAVSVVVNDHVQGPAFGAAFGAATIVFGLGLAIGPQLGGYLADLTGSFQAPFAVAVGCALLGAAVTPAAIRRST